MMTDINKLIADLSTDATPVKTMPHPLISFVKWSAGAIVYLVLLMCCTGLRSDIGLMLHSHLFMMEIGMLIAIILTSGISITLLSFPDMYQKRWAMFMPFLPLALFCLVILIEWISDKPPAPKPEHGWDCLLCITFYSVVPACWIFYRLRKMASAHVSLVGGMALLTASAIGCLALRLSEQTNSVSHLIEWHYLPMLSFSALGLWLGKKFLKW